MFILLGGFLNGRRNSLGPLLRPLLRLRAVVVSSVELGQGGSDSKAKPELSGGVMGSTEQPVPSRAGIMPHLSPSRVVG